MPPINTKQKQSASEKVFKVYDLKIRGWRVPEIAAATGIPIRTVYRLLKEGDRITEGQIRNLTRGAVLRELMVSHQARHRKAWDLISTTKMDVVKVACLKQLLDEDQRYEKLLARMKVIEDSGLTLEDLLTGTMRTSRENAAMVNLANEVVEKLAQLIPDPELQMRIADALEGKTPTESTHPSTKPKKKPKNKVT